MAQIAGRPSGIRLIYRTRSGRPSRLRAISVRPRPPPPTTTVLADRADPVSGMSYDRLGEVSRAFHASQNMGFWRSPAQASWALHLGGGKAEGDIRDGLPAYPACWLIWESALR